MREFVFAVFSPYPGTDSFADGAKLRLYPPDCWDKMMKDPLCGVEVPVCWEEHLSKDEILELLKIAHRKFYMKPKFFVEASLGITKHVEIQASIYGCTFDSQIGNAEIKQ